MVEIKDKGETWCGWMYEINEREKIELPTPKSPLEMTQGKFEIIENMARNMSMIALRKAT